LAAGWYQKSCSSVYKKAAAFLWPPRAQLYVPPSMGLTNARSNRAPTPLSSGKAAIRRSLPPAFQVRGCQDSLRAQHEVFCLKIKLSWVFNVGSPRFAVSSGPRSASSVGILGRFPDNNHAFEASASSRAFFSSSVLLVFSQATSRLLPSASSPVPLHQRFYLAAGGVSLLIE